MNLLLDTPILLWWYENPRLLKPEALKIIENQGNEIFVSATVFWEISIKTALGKLTVPAKMPDRILIDFTELPINASHAREVSLLPPIHQDPFDRLLIAQARVEEMTLITRDQKIMKYPDIHILEA